MVKGIENIKIALFAIISAANTFKTSQKPLLSILLNIGKFIKINFKQVTAEIKDLTVEERGLLVDWLTEQGVASIAIEKVIANLSSEKKTTMLNLTKDILKTK